MKISEMTGFRQVSAGLIKVVDDYWHWCQGCNRVHRIRTGPGDGPRWSFNGNAGRPTFSPSVRHTRGNAAGPTVCHYVITNGEIAYCDDCTHPLVGMRVAVPPLPSEDLWYG